MAFLGNGTILNKVSEFFELKRPVAAVCHRVLGSARAKYKSVKSVIQDRKVTTVLKWLEIQVVFVTNYLVRMPAQDYQFSTAWPLYCEEGARGNAGELVVGTYDILAPLLNRNGHKSHSCLCC
jgi:hypothetical protein